MHRLSVGEIISHERWTTTKYEVVAKYGNEEYTLKNLDTLTTVEWYYPRTFDGLVVEKVVPLGNVIRKVAFMNKRWDNRHA